MKGNGAFALALIIFVSGCLHAGTDPLTESEETALDVITSYVKNMNDGEYELACMNQISYDNGKFLTEYPGIMENCIKNYSTSACGLLNVDSDSDTYCDLDMIYMYTLETEYNSSSAYTGTVNNIWTNMTYCLYNDEENWSCEEEDWNWHVMMNLSQNRWGILGMGLNEWASGNLTFGYCDEGYVRCSYESTPPHVILESSIVNGNRHVEVTEIIKLFDICSFSWHLQMGDIVETGATCPAEGEESDCATFHDNDGDGNLTVGDVYDVDISECSGGDAEYFFSIVYDLSGDIIRTVNIDVT